MASGRQGKAARPRQQLQSHALPAVISILLFLSGSTLGLVAANLITVVTLGACPRSARVVPAPRPSAAPSRPFAYLR